MYLVSSSVFSVPLASSSQLALKTLPCSIAVPMSLSLTPTNLPLSLHRQSQVVSFFWVCIRKWNLLSPKSLRGLNLFCCLFRFFLTWWKGARNPSSTLPPFGVGFFSNKIIGQYTEQTCIYQGHIRTRSKRNGAICIKIDLWNRNKDVVLQLLLQLILHGSNRRTRK